MLVASLYDPLPTLMFAASVGFRDTHKCHVPFRGWSFENQIKLEEKSHYQVNGTE